MIYEFNYRYSVKFYNLEFVKAYQKYIHKSPFLQFDGYNMPKFDKAY